MRKLGWLGLCAAVTAGCGADLTGGTGGVPDGSGALVDLGGAADLAAAGDLMEAPPASVKTGLGGLPGCAMLPAISAGPVTMIGSAADVAKVASGGRYRLAADVDMAGANVSLGAPPGMPIANFIVEGAGHKLVGMAQGAGLFANANCFIIADLVVDHGTLTVAAPSSGLLVGNGIQGALVTVRSVDGRMAGAAAREMTPNNGTVRFGGLVGSLTGGLLDGITVTNLSATIDCSAAAFHCFTGGVAGNVIGVTSRGLRIDAHLAINTSGNGTYGNLIGGAFGFSSAMSTTDVEVGGEITFAASGPTGNNRIGGLVGDVRDPLSAIRSTVSIRISGTEDGAAGGVAGMFGDDKARCSGCDWSGTITDSGNPAGGIAGYLFGSIEASRAAGSITSSSPVGGTAGGVAGAINDGARIDRSYSSAGVKARTAGGLVGTAQGNATIADSYSLGPVSSTVMGQNNGFVGGVLGLAYAAGGATQTVTRVYSLATVAGTGAGGIVGGATLHPPEMAVTVTDAYFDAGRVTCAQCVTLGNAVAPAALQMQATFKNWDFMKVWRMPAQPGGPTMGSPELQWQ